MMTAWLYRRSDLEIIGLVELPDDLPDVLFLGESMYLRRGDDISRGRVVYVEALVQRINFSRLSPPPDRSCATPDIICVGDDPTQPLKSLPDANNDRRNRWDS